MQHLPKDDLRKLFELYDTDHNNKVSFEEYVLTVVVLMDGTLDEKLTRTHNNPSIFPLSLKPFFYSYLQFVWYQSWRNYHSARISSRCEAFCPGWYRAWSRTLHSENLCEGTFLISIFIELPCHCFCGSAIRMVMARSPLKNSAIFWRPIANPLRRFVEFSPLASEMTDECVAREARCFQPLIL